MSHKWGSWHIRLMICIVVLCLEPQYEPKMVQSKQEIAASPGSNLALHQLSRLQRHCDTCTASIASTFYLPCLLFLLWSPSLTQNYDSQDFLCASNKDTVHLAFAFFALQLVVGVLPLRLSYPVSVLPQTRQRVQLHLPLSQAVNVFPFRSISQCDKGR